ncbi:hypothetical protein [Nocardia sp. NPDC004722]
MNRVVFRRAWIPRALAYTTIVAFVATLVSLDGWEWLGNIAHVLAHIKVFAALEHVVGWLGVAGKVVLITVVTGSIAVTNWWKRRVSPGMSSESPDHPPTVSGPPTAG